MQGLSRLEEGLWIQGLGWKVLLASLENPLNPRPLILAAESPLYGCWRAPQSVLLRGALEAPSASQ